jgi:polar amino acid transport system substrate-binding protein
MSLKSSLTVLAVFAALAISTQSHAQQVVRVGTNANVAPLSFLHAKSNTYRGISADLITAIAKDAGFTVEWVLMPIPELIPALNGNKIDVIAANLAITPERRTLVDFSEPFHRGPGDALIVPKADIKDYRSLDELKGTIIGAAKGTPQLAKIQASGLFPDVTIYENVSEALRAVNNGGVAAILVGGTFAQYQDRQGNLPNAPRVSSFQSAMSAGDAFSLRKGDSELLGKINASLARLQADGTVKKILAEYGF